MKWRNLNIIMLSEMQDKNSTYHKTPFTGTPQKANESMVIESRPLIVWLLSLSIMTSWGWCRADNLRRERLQST